MFGREKVKPIKMELKDKVMLALDEIRPFLAADGGDISLIEII